MISKQSVARYETGMIGGDVGVAVGRYGWLDVGDEDGASPAMLAGRTRVPYDTDCVFAIPV